MVCPYGFLPPRRWPTCRRRFCKPAKSSRPPWRCSREGSQAGGPDSAPSQHADLSASAPASCRRLQESVCGAQGRRQKPCGSRGGPLPRSARFVGCLPHPCLLGTFVAMRCRCRMRLPQRTGSFFPLAGHWLQRYPCKLAGLRRPVGVRVKTTSADIHVGPSRV